MSTEAVTDFERSLQSQIRWQQDRIAEMTSLLNQMPHQYVNLGDGQGCFCLPECPACAWVKLKESK